MTADKPSDEEILKTYKRLNIVLLINGLAFETAQKQAAICLYRFAIERTKEECNRSTTSLLAAARKDAQEQARASAIDDVEKELDKAEKFFPTDKKYAIALIKCNEVAEAIAAARRKSP
jgi:hypothetical protein